MTKLKIIKEFIFFVVAIIIIDFIISKLFKTKFSFYHNILIGIGAYIGYYFFTKKNSND